MNAVPDMYVLYFNFSISAGNEYGAYNIKMLNLPHHKLIYKNK